MQFFDKVVDVPVVAQGQALVLLQVQLIEHVVNISVVAHGQIPRFKRSTDSANCTVLVFLCCVSPSALPDVM